MKYRTKTEMNTKSMVQSDTVREKKAAHEKERARKREANRCHHRYTIRMQCIKYGHDMKMNTGVRIINKDRNDVMVRAKNFPF